jgi:hypothetical protein
MLCNHICYRDVLNWFNDLILGLKDGFVVWKSHFIICPNGHAMPW